MNQISLVFFFVLLVSCAPSNEKIRGRIDDSIRAYLEKAASKSTKELTINEVKTTSFTMVTAGHLDTLSKAIYTRKIMYFRKLQKSVGAGATAYLDSANYYDKLDSLTTLQIANRWQNPKEYYYAKTYVDVTRGNVETADTVWYALDKTFRVMPMP